MCGRSGGGCSTSSVMDRPTRSVVYMKKQLRKTRSIHAHEYRRGRGRRRKVVNHSRKCFYVFTTNAQSVRVPRGDLFFIRVSIIFYFSYLNPNTAVDRRRRNGLPTKRTRASFRFRAPITLP